MNAARQDELPLPPPETNTILRDRLSRLLAEFSDTDDTGRRDQLYREIQHLERVLAGGPS